MFVNDGFGDVLASTDALGRVIAFGVDALGRVKTRTDTHAGKSLTTTWTWDTAPNGIGRLHMLESPDGIKTYAYSQRGQLEGTTLSVAGESFTARMTYDDMGRVASVDYPQPLGELPFGVTYEHDNHGHRIGVRDTYTNDAYWQLTDVDQAGRYKGEMFGNGVTTARGYDHEKGALKSITTTKGAATIQQLSYDWDERLNLKSRTDARQPVNKTERFRYDALNRLTCAYFGLVENPNAPCDTSYGYAPNGNIVSKSDVGILSYTDPTHPHAVTNAAGDSFYHDAVGNQITRPGGVIITYTPFDLPKTITQGAKVTTFGYDGDQQRIRKTTSTTETIYFDDLYEQVKTTSGIEHRYHVHSPERVVAIVTRDGQEPGTRYLHVDHVGSIETTTKENGTIDERRSYDAFGARRNPEWGGSAIAFTSKTKKGFTGHEEADEYGLVNMKGRVYDPRIGRFTTTDPIIANVYNGQSLGAYAYVRNNPLAFVDPSGFTEEEARRLWRVEETPGQLGIHITFDPLPPPTPRPTPPPHAADVGAQAATTDVGTTGNGAAAPPQGATVVEKGSVGDAVWDGVGDAARGLWDDWTSTPLPTIERMYDAYDKGDAVDAFNVVNPLIAFANVSLANDDGDTYSVTRQSTAIGVTVIVGVVIGKVIGGQTGAGKGGKTTRGPPDDAAALNAARAARDAKAAEVGGLRPPARPATVTAGYHIETRQIAVGCSGGGCAEGKVVQQLGGDASKVKFTEAVRPRPDGPPFKQVPVCQNCETQYGREPFPSGTQFKGD
ncbi:MAG: RHS repeat-associated core domain-containing protein [Polyangiaceae bacterium]|nr:RHS repeat-associated core domain-containing protein [Polyangiaceae bacterium]